MSLDNDLFALEQQFWPGGADFYRDHLDDRCIVAFAEMSGLMPKEQIADMIKNGQRWRDLKLTRKGFLAPTRDIAILTYAVDATRDDGARHQANVSSVYVDRVSAWKMAFHQQTPLPG
jgi:hypothetical protein